MGTEPGGGWRSFIVRLLALLLFILSTTFLALIIERVIHEVLGHGLMTLALGGKFSGFTVCLLGESLAYAFPAASSPPSEQVLISAAGIAANLIFGLGCLAGMSWMKKESFLRLGFTIFAGASLLEATSYAAWGAFSPGSKGDVGTILEVSAAGWLRWPLLAVSAAGLVCFTFIINLCLFQFLEAWLSGGRSLTGRRRLLILLILGGLGGLGWWIPDWSDNQAYQVMRIVGSAVHIGTAVLLLLRSPPADPGHVPLKAAVLPTVVSWGLTMLVLALAIVPALPVSAPRPTPPTLPEPNGYPALVEAGSRCERAFRAGEDEPSLEELQGIVERNMPAILDARRALALDCRIPVEVGDGGELQFTAGAVELRNLSDAFIAASRLAASREDLKGAIEFALDAVRMGLKGARGGLLINWIISFGLQDRGFEEVRRVAPKLNLSGLEEILLALTDLARRREPLEDAMALEKKYFPVMAAGEWRRQLKCGCASILWDNSPFLSMNYQDLERNAVARWHLLLTDLSIHGHQARTGRLPESLDAVSPAIPAWILEDPYANGRRLIYRPDAARFALYSVGPNHKDDGGGASTRVDEDEAVDDLTLDD